MQQAPYPCSENKHGRRPHGIVDRGKEYNKEGLKTLSGQTYQPTMQDDIFVWGFPANNFNYNNQNCRGNPRANQDGTPAGDDTEPGWSRIITDRDKKIQGLSVHPPHDPGKLERVSQAKREVIE